MKKSASLQNFLLLILFMAAPLSAFAATEPVATVVAVRGTVTAQGASGAARNLAIKSQVFQEDVLKTDPNGQLQIMFTDSSIISLGRGSEMKIAEYRWQAGKKDGALRTQVKEGAFRVMGGALAKDAPQNFKTETPTATIGIRGSMYAGVTTADFLSVVFQGGKGIELYNEHGTIAITVPGFGSRVALNAAPERPHRFTVQELNNINRQLNGQNAPTQGGAPTEEATISTALLTDTTLFAPPPPPELPPANEFPTAPSNALLVPSTSAILNTSFSGTYFGGLQGTSTTTAGTSSFTGIFSMLVNFSGGLNPDGFYAGAISIPGVDSGTVMVTAFSATPTSNSFSGTFNGAIITSGTFSGAFYGPGAEKVKGDFAGSGTSPTPISIQGTFGGDRITSAPPPPVY